MLETNRLILRHITRDDKNALFTLLSDDNVSRYMSQSTFTSLNQIDRLLDYWLPLYEKPWNERFAIVLKETNTMIGYIDLVAYEDELPEIGYGLCTAYWNKGYMTEALEAFTNHLFALGYQQTILGVVDKNIGSSKVALKCGYSLYKKEVRKFSESKYYDVTIEWFKKDNPSYKEFIITEKITTKNIEKAHQIANIIFPHYDPYNNYLDSFKPDSKDTFWLLKVNNQYIGISGLYYYDAYPEDAWLGWFGLLDEYQNRHFGTQALALFEIEAKKKCFKYARLFTNRFENDKAKNFYKRHGYKEEFYELDSDPASKIYPLSIFSKSLLEGVEVPLWDNRDIHFTKKVAKQE